MTEKTFHCPVCKRYSESKFCSHCLGDEYLVELENREKEVRLDKQRIFYQSCACGDLENEERRLGKPKRKILKWLREESFNFSMTREILDKEINSIKRERQSVIEDILNARKRGISNGCKATNPGSA